MKKLIVILLALLALGAQALAADEGPGHKEFRASVGSEKFDTGVRSDNFCVAATGPFKSDGTPRPGATQWFNFSLWDYVNGSWSRVFPRSVPAACPACTTWTVPPGGQEARRLNGYKFRAIVIHRGTTVADSAGALFDWWKD